MQLTILTNADENISHRIKTNSEKISCQIDFFTPEQLNKLLDLDRLSSLFSHSKIINKEFSENSSTEIPHLLKSAPQLLTAAKIKITNMTSKNIYIQKDKLLKTDLEKNFIIPTEQILKLYPKSSQKNMNGGLKIALGIIIGACSAIITNRYFVKREHETKKELERLFSKNPLAFLLFFPVTLSIVPLRLFLASLKTLLFTGASTIPGIAILAFGFYDLHELSKIQQVKNALEKSAKSKLLETETEFVHSAENKRITIPPRSIFENILFINLKKNHSDIPKIINSELCYQI